MAWVVSATVLRAPDNLGAQAEIRLRRSDRLLLLLPSLLIFAYLLHFLPRIAADLGTRDWTIGQRLLTEPRVLLDYLGLLFVPRAMSTGLFNDEYVVSSGWLQPWTTLPAIALVVAMAVLAFCARTRAPRLSTGGVAPTLDVTQPTACSRRLCPCSRGARDLAGGAWRPASS